MSNLKSNVGGTWHDTSAVWVKINGTWRAVSTVWANVGGVWKTTFQSFAIGNDYGGGKIAYIDGSGIHGLIAAAANQSTGHSFHGTNDGTTGASGTAIGTGNANTNAIIALYGAEVNAARLCYDLSLNGYTDWYLPSKDELHQLYLNQVAIGGFLGICYWSSSEYDAANAWGEYFNYANQNATLKYYGGGVRAVRSF